jgi:hypothetical protein
VRGQPHGFDQKTSGPRSNRLMASNCVLGNHASERGEL